MGAGASVSAEPIVLNDNELVTSIHAKIAETAVEGVETTLESVSWPVDSFTVTGTANESGAWTVTYDATQEQIDAALAKYTEGGLDSDASSALLKTLLEKEIALVTGFPEEVTVEQGAVLKGLLAPPAPVEEAPVEEAPKEEAPVEEAPKEEAPVEEAPKEEAPVEETPAPVEETPAPVEDAPAPVEDAPAPVEEAPKTVDAPSEEVPPSEAA
jgi:outer membrane biosynthesis protein TonB